MPNHQESLTFSHFRKTNLNRSAKWHNGQLELWTTSDWALSLVGEVGELCNTLKKLKRSRDGIPGNTESDHELLSNIPNELADILIYLDLLAASINIELELALKNKFNRVSESMNFDERL